MTKKKGEKVGKETKDTRQRLENLGKDLVAEINKGDSPSFEAPLRGRGNVFFDKHEGLLRLGEKKEKRTFLNVAQAKKFMQTIAIAAKCKKFKEEDLHTSIRGLFYQLKFTLGEDVEEDMFEEQAQSVHPDEFLVVRIDGKLKFMTGRELVESASKLGNVKEGNPSTIITGAPISAPSFDRNQKIKEHDVVSVIKNNSKRNMLQIITESGREVRVTPFHSLFTLDGEGKVTSVPASSLGIGDPIAIPRKIEIAEDDSPVNILNYLAEAPLKIKKRLYLHSDKKVVGEILNRIRSSGNKIRSSYYSQLKWNCRIPLALILTSKVNVDDLLEKLSISCIGGRHKYPILIKKDKYLGRAIGYLLSEGAHMIIAEGDYAKNITFSVKSKKIMDDFIDSFGRSFGSLTTKPKLTRKDTFPIYRINVGYDLLSFILEYVFGYRAGEKSWEKEIPTVLLDAPASCVKGLIAAFRAGDGTFQNEGSHRVVRFYTSSKKLVNGLVFLLLRLGIFPRLCKAAEKPKRHEKYILYVGSREDTEKLITITGDRAKYKQKSTYDFLPVLEIVMQAKKYCKVPEKEYKSINFYTKTKMVSRTKLQDIIRILKRYTKEKNKYLKQLEILASSHIYWDKIKELRDGGKAPFTIDLSVVSEGKLIENFIGGLGALCLHNSNPIIEDLETALSVKREDLNLSTDRKGAVAGNLIIRDKFGGEEVTIDCSKQGRSGWMIPSDVDNGMDFVKVDAKYVLVIEKDALWQRLNEDKFWKKENCIIITPKGQASRGCRRLIRKLADKKIPVYAFMDCDAWGWYIYWTIKTGSMNLAYLGSEIATPEAKFIGVTMKDIQKYDFLKKLTIKAKEVDVKRAQEMLGYPWIAAHPEWVEELKTVLETKKKIEQDALQGPRLTFVGEYIRDKIKAKNFLP